MSHDVICTLCKQRMLMQPISIKLFTMCIIIKCKTKDNFRKKKLVMNVKRFTIGRTAVFNSKTINEIIVIINS